MKKIVTFGLILACGSMAQAFPEVSSFLAVKPLEAELKSLCGKVYAADSKPEMTVLESATQHSADVDFESIRFKMVLKNKNKDSCTKERQIIQILGASGSRSSLYDSGFYADPYCGDPVRLVQGPRVYKMEVIADSHSDMQRKLAVIEWVHSTLPCPDIDDSRGRRFAIYDLENNNQLFLEVEADYVISEIGDQSYRLHLINVQKVVQSAQVIPGNQIPYAIELRKTGFELELRSFEKKKSKKK